MSLTAKSDIKALSASRSYNEILKKTEQDKKTRFIELDEEEIEKRRKELALEIIEDLKNRTIRIGFAMYGSSDERKMENSFYRNFALFYDIEGSEFKQLRPSHFFYNGSWEVLDEEMKRDKVILEEMGFKFRYEGYMPESDVIF